MWRQVIAELAIIATNPICVRLLQSGHFSYECINLGLLAHDHLVQLIHQVLTKTGFHFQFGEALINNTNAFHNPLVYPPQLFWRQLKMKKLWLSVASRVIMFPSAAGPYSKLAS